MNKKFNYQSWYDKQNSKKTDLLYEKLTKHFVGKNLLKEQEERQLTDALKTFLASYKPENDKNLIERVKPTVAEYLSFLGIDFGTTEGKDILNFATIFVLRHFTQIQIKGEEKNIQQTQSMVSDLTQLMKMIFINAFEQNKQLFKQFSSLSRAKAGAEVIGKQASKDFEEFGSELGRTGKQAWADIKSGVSKLFEAAPQAAGAGAAAGGAAIVQTTTAALNSAAQAAAPTVVQLAKANLLNVTAGVAAQKGAAEVALTLAQRNLIRMQIAEQGTNIISKFLTPGKLLVGSAVALAVICWDNISKAFKGWTSAAGSTGAVAAQAGKKAEEFVGIKPEQDKPDAADTEEDTKVPPEGKPKRGKKKLKPGSYGQDFGSAF